MEITFTEEEMEILRKAQKEQKELDREEEPIEDVVKGFLMAHVRQLLPDMPDLYRDIIEIKEDVSDATLAKIKEICIVAHKNRAGEVPLTPVSKYKFYFEGEYKDRGCLVLAYLALDDVKLFMDNVKSWKWEDANPNENCNLYVELTRPIAL